MDLFTELEENSEQKFEVYPLKDDSEIWYMKHFLKQKEANEYFNVFYNTVEWRQENIEIYGKIHPYPRLIAWFGYEGQDYVYSGYRRSMKQWTPELLSLKQKIETLLPWHKFNSVLLNLYRNGNDKVAWHADHEKDTIENPLIASLSLGATRRFDIKHRTEPGLEMKFELENGSLIIMKDAFQHYWMHQVPVQKKVTEARINLTFRKIGTVLGNR
ncbi:MAG TPA: alpha-ketoglutarate-dependent dioxygenase AlkB [Bacteroidales bacterium]|nr:alpha-ketoglutarate-dependent dioxygenase AlkB [Bacteroidales bacterium]